MTEPTFDADGYPTEATLDRIREWPIVTLADMVDCMDFAGRAWSSYGTWRKYSDWKEARWPSRPLVRYTFATGGWSGNESVVAAIEANLIVQMVGAWAWKRGGWYEYRFPKEPG